MDADQCRIESLLKKDGQIFITQSSEPFEVDSSAPVVPTSAKVVEIPE